MEIFKLHLFAFAIALLIYFVFPLNPIEKLTFYNKLRFGFCAAIESMRSKCNGSRFFHLGYIANIAEAFATLH